MYMATHKPSEGNNTAFSHLEQRQYINVATIEVNRARDQSGRKEKWSLSLLVTAL